MLINVVEDESRIAIIEDNILQEMLIEHRNKEQLKGNIYRGVVVQIQTSLQAAFIDFGEKKHGFLPNSDVNPALTGHKGKKVRDTIQSKLKSGQSILVQVTREPVDQKGAALTTNISMAGRFMVLNPDSNKGGISKKIEDVEERDRLKSFISGIQSEEHSVIIRTAGFGRSLGELKKDYTNLKKSWETVDGNFKKSTGPALIKEEDDFVTRTIRDYYTEDIKEIWIDDPETFQKALSFFKEIIPQRQKDLRLYVDDRSMFSAYKVEKQVEQLTSREVRLKSGGSIVIDQTEALVAIDVNSGKSNQEKNNRATAFRTNLEAAEETARQLRLRNLGGLIVIDFIDMDDEKSKREVENRIREIMSRDKGHHAMNSISEFGLLEMSRQRLAAGISSTVENICPVCRGKGKIPSLLASTNLIIRAIREIAAKGNVERIEGELPLELSNYLLNDRRQAISDLEMEFGITVSLRGDPKITTFSEKFFRTYFHGKVSEAIEMDQQIDVPNQQPKRNKNTKREKSKSDEFPKTEESVKKEAATTSENRNENKPLKHQKSPNDEKPKRVDNDNKETKETTQNDLDHSEPSIHKGCLFEKVFALSDDELKEVTTSFENRMKGKISNQVPTKINDEFLWDLTNSDIGLGNLERPHLNIPTPVFTDSDFEENGEDFINDPIEIQNGTVDVNKGEKEGEKNKKEPPKAKKRVKKTTPKTAKKEPKSDTVKEKANTKVAPKKKSIRKDPKKSKKPAKKQLEEVDAGNT